MTERSKKKLIAWLLLISCIGAGWLLFLTPARPGKSLHSGAQTDSLLKQTLANFNIPQTQVSSRQVYADSEFTRINYRIKVPPAFSKTQFHAALQQKLSPYGLELPARVTFPERNMDIHFYYGDDVIRTVELVTDEDLRLKQSFASFIVSFEGQPDEDLVQFLTGMGEPIPIAIKLYPPLTLPGWWNEFRTAYKNPVYIWPQNKNGQHLLFRRASVLDSELEFLAESAPNTVLLHFFKSDETASMALQDTPFDFIDARDALILNAAAGRAAFNQTFRALLQRARQGRPALAIIIASEKSLAWTQEELNRFKKGGLMIQPPRKVRY